MTAAVTQHARIYPERNAEVPAGVFGTPGTPTYKYMRFLTTDITGGPMQTPEYDAMEAFGHTGIENTGSMYGGQITSKSRVDELTLMYQAFFGKVVTGGLVDATYTHVYTPLDDLTLVAPSLGLDVTIEKKRIYAYSGVLVNEITVSKVNAGEVNHTYDIIAKSRTLTAFAAGTPAYSALGKLQTVFLATIHGQAVVWESLTIKMNRNWDKTLAFSSQTIPDAEIGLFTAEIEGVVKFENANPNFISAFELGTEGELTIEFRGALLGATTYETLKFEFDRVKIMDAPPPQINADRKTQSIKLQVLIPLGANDWCKASITNIVATPATYP